MILFSSPEECFLPPFHYLLYIIRIAVYRKLLWANSGGIMRCIHPVLSWKLPKQSKSVIAPLKNAAMRPNKIWAPFISYADVHRPRATYFPQFGSLSVFSDQRQTNRTDLGSYRSSLQETKGRSIEQSLYYHSIELSARHSVRQQGISISDHRPATSLSGKESLTVSAALLATVCS